MILEIDGPRTKVSKASVKTLFALKAALKVRAQNYFWNPRYQAFRKHGFGWAGFVDFLDLDTRSFPTGLLPLVREWSKQNNGLLQVRRSSPLPPPVRVPTPRLFSHCRNEDGSEFILRDDQIEAIERFLKKKSCIIQAGTGAGKTEVFCGAIKCLKLRTLVLVSTLDLLGQTRARLRERLGHRVGVLSGKKWRPKDVTVASVQTLNSIIERSKQRSVVVKVGRKKFRKRLPQDEVDKRRRRYEKLLNYLEGVEFVIGDEVQFAQAKSWRSVLNLLPNTHYRLGVSARPFSVEQLSPLGHKKLTSQDLNIVSCFGPVVYNITSSELVRKNILARPHIFLEPIQGDVYDELTYPEARTKLLVKSKLRNNAIVKAAVGAAKLNQLVLVIAGHSVKHSKILYKRLKAQTHGVHLLYGNTKAEVREQVRRLANTDRKKVRIIVTTTVWDLGVDVPNINVLIMAGGGKQPRRTIQRIGRVLRKKKVNIAWILDFVDYRNEHLYKHSKARLKEYLAESEYIVELLRPSSHGQPIRSMVKKARPNGNVKLAA